MEIKVLSAQNQEKGKQKLPKQFTEQVRPDLIKKAVYCLQSSARTPYGAKPDAGLRPSADLSRRRRKYRGSYGFGISRVPRKILSRRGTRMNWVGAVAPGTIGGRRAHPPKAEKVWEKKMNTKERRKAIRSALAASVTVDFVKEHGHKVPASYPFVLETTFETAKKTSDVKKALTALGFEKELARCEEKKIRAGKGKARGRKYKKKVGPLLVVSDACDLQKSGSNIPGIQVLPVKELNAEALAPGGVPGRCAIFTQKALEVLEKEKLFTQNGKAKAE